LAPNAEIHFEGVAVTRRQIEVLNLPTRPSKATDSRIKNFHGESVEVDAIAPATLRLMTRNCIEPHIDQQEYARLQVIEESERETLRNLAAFA
jgi:hypothetical protein